MQMPAAGAAHALRRRLVLGQRLSRAMVRGLFPRTHTYSRNAIKPPFAGTPSSRGLLRRASLSSRSLLPPRRLGRVGWMAMGAEPRAIVWQQTVPGLSFRVVYDEPDRLPGKSTRTAMVLFAALQQQPSAQNWFIKHIRNAVVHCAGAADAITVVGDSIHFFEAKLLSEDLGTQLFDRLTLTQKQDFDQLYAGRDARQEFADFVMTGVGRMN